jgi:aspartyl-tRNA(Asn)/glutamyl-tRNA(Gln) amidotransferase subunit A
MMSGEQITLDGLTAPRLAIPAGFVTGVDEATARAWGLVSKGLPEVEFPERDRLFKVGLSILLYEAAAYHHRWASEFPEKYGTDVLSLIRRGEGVSRSDYEDAMDERPRLAEAAVQAMRDIDALVVPATAIVAPPVDAGPEVREPMARFTRPFNTTYQPVAVLPAPVNGLPVGIQVVGRTNQDTLRAAMWLEREWSGLVA